MSASPVPASASFCVRTAATTSPPLCFYMGVRHIQPACTAPAPFRKGLRKGSIKVVGCNNNEVVGELIVTVVVEVVPAFPIPRHPCALGKVIR